MPIKKSIFVKFTFILVTMILLFSVTIVMLYRFVMVEELSELKKQIVKEQVMMIVSRSEQSRMTSEFKEISQSIFNLDLVDEVFIYNDNCELLAAIPYKNKSYGCNDLNELNYFVVEVKDLISPIRKIYIHFRADSNLLNKVNYLGLLFILLFSLGIAGMTYFAVSKLIFKRITNEIQAMTNESGAHSEKIPLELQQIYKLLQKYALKVKQLNAVIVEKEKSEARFELAQKVAHDIRSPLEALRTVTGRLEMKDSSTKILLSSSIARITNIANDLLKERPSKKMELVNLRILLEQICFDKSSEKSTPLNLVTEIPYRDTFVNINETQVYRSISNLLNNAIESQNKGHEIIDLTLEVTDKKLILVLKDYGPGMSEDLLNKALAGKFTTKANGNGIGVSSSKEYLLKNNASFDIISKEGSGTTITISFTQEPTPAWFCDEIKVKSENVICVDDDESFRKLYLEKLSPQVQKLEVLDQFDFQKRDLKSTKVFIDYDLGLSFTGVDYILDNSLTDATLVTSMYDDKMLQNKCMKVGVKIIPKQIFNSIPVIVNPSLHDEQLDAVLIDDDELIHMSWQYEADKKGKALKCYKSVEDFLQVADSIDRSTKIFVDSNLSDGLKGEIESEKIFNLGFKEIYLATGYSASVIEKPAWIKEVIGKRASL